MSARTIVWGIGIAVVVIVACKFAGNPMISFIHWTQSIGVSHK